MWRLLTNHNLFVQIADVHLQSAYRGWTCKFAIHYVQAMHLQFADIRFLTGDYLYFADEEPVCQAVVSVQFLTWLLR